MLNNKHAINKQLQHNPIHPPPRIVDFNNINKKVSNERGNMAKYRRALVLRFGLIGLVSMMLVMATGAFSFIAKAPSKLSIRDSTNVFANECDSLLRRKVTKIRAASANTDGDSGAAAAESTLKGAVGLYKQYADYATEQLLGTGWLKEDSSVPEDLSANQAPARGAKTESIVRITTKALVPTSSTPLIRYARITLLETVPLVIEDSTKAVSPDGIQVLNFVVLPNKATTLPVLGIDLVSLPGSKHLLLLDAQPMAEPNPHEGHWELWYNKHVQDSSDENEAPLKYAWGGDFPEAVQKYVSKYALWTRLQNLPDSVGEDEMETMSPSLDAIQGDLLVAFRAHLDAYLELLESYADKMETVVGENHQPSYLDYRRNNDPAKPMLNSLYGADWTQSLLDNVLFPKD